MTQIVSLFGMSLPVEPGKTCRRPPAVGGRPFAVTRGRRPTADGEPPTPGQGQITSRCAVARVPPVLASGPGRTAAQLRCDGEGRETRYAYDHAGRVVQVDYADGSSRHLAYDDQGRLVSETDPAGRTTGYRYDARGMLAQIDYADGRRVTVRLSPSTTLPGPSARTGRTGPHGEAWRYDAEGRPVEIADWSCVIRYGYDSAGRLVRQERTVEGRTFVTGYAYDERGRCVGLLPPGSHYWLRYEYDDRGRLTAIQTDDGLPLLRHTYEEGQVHTAFGNGITTEHKLGGVGGLRQIRTWAPGRDEPILDLTLAYDRTGNVVRAGERRFEYDRLGQLVAAHDEGQTTCYAYDLAGNRVAQGSSSGGAGCAQRSCATAQQGTPRDGHAWTGYQYDILDRLTVELRADGTGFRYAHDRCGNLIRRQGPAGAVEYTYDAAGRLVEVAREGQIMARYTYDARGHRLRVEADGQAVTEHRDPLGQLLAETTPDGRVLATYVWTGGRVVARIPGPVGSHGVVYYHLDHLGSTRAVTDSQGQVLWSGGYGPFGEATMVNGSEPRFGFAGYEWEPRIGLYYAGARWYDPALGRFLTPDSYTHGPDDPRRLWGWGDDSTLAAWLRHPRRFNRYAYCLNNPATYVDLDGHDALGVFLTIIGFIWALPCTVFGCALWLSLEIVNLIALILSLTGVFQKLGIDGHSSGDLSTFGLFFEGGMIGSIMNGVSGGAWKAFTCGYTVFIQKPEAGNNSTICHELRHTNQYGWFGPFFALPALIAPFITLPTLGLDLIFHFLKSEPLKRFLLAQTFAPLVTVYFWDVVINGYQNAWAERDAQAYEPGC